MVAIDENFKNCGKTVGIEIWRIKVNQILDKLIRNTKMKTIYIKTLIVVFTFTNIYSGFQSVATRQN
jgi:hypothetical protein